MILSDILSAEHSLPTTHKVAYEILNRLRVAESECAYFKIKQPLYKLYRPSSSAETTENHLLESINMLADLIHTAYSQTLLAKSNNQLKTIAYAMFPRLKDFEIQNAIIAYVDKSNAKIIRAFNKVQSINDQLPTIQTLLIKAFPNIDQDRLQTTINHMITHSNQPQPALSTADEKKDDDYFHVGDTALEGFSNYSMFAKNNESSEKPIAEKTSSCTVS